METSNKQSEENNLQENATPNSMEATENIKATENTKIAEDFRVAKDKAAEDFKVAKDKATPKAKSGITLLIIGILAMLGGGACFAIPFFIPKEERASLQFPKIPSSTAENSDEKFYSRLSGEQLADANSVTAPIYCVQTPNGLDGARPQSGLNEAGVVFEAIAERGITRFAALYQNAETAIIGPIRSLRLYYLEWDTPFDCTIVHAGGADDALAAVRNGDYKDLTENYTYMYRGNYNYHLWNNLFTTPDLLSANSNDNNRTTSNATGFTRITPEQAQRDLVNSQIQNPLDITKPAQGSTTSLEPSVTEINVNFGQNNDYNVRYIYNAYTNSYDRYYANGTEHNVYDCPAENLYGKDPQDVCSTVQLSPKIVIVMGVNESVASDNYHENITTTGTGKATIYQNGIAISGTWTKASAGDQIRFYDQSSKEIALIPGQTWISAVPNYLF